MCSSIFNLDLTFQTFGWASFNIGGAFQWRNISQARYCVK